VESVFVKDYYFTHRPMVWNANVLEIGYAPLETMSPAVPEPSTWALFALGSALCWCAARRRRK
jgi:hypothetical protein